MNAAIFDPSTSELLQIGAVEYADIAKQERAVQRARETFDSIRHPSARAVEALREYYERFRDLEGARENARAAFAEKIGGNVGAPFTLDELRAGTATGLARVNPCDAFVGIADYLWQNCRPIGVVGHTRRAWRECYEFGTSQGFQVDALPGSWVGPGVYIAVLYTRRGYIPTAP